MPEGTVNHAEWEVSADPESRAKPSKKAIYAKPKPCVCGTNGGESFLHFPKTGRIFLTWVVSFQGGTSF